MSYEPSHRKAPRQERWPDATPGEGWPAYQQGDEDRAWESAAAFAGSRNGYGGTSNGYGGTSNGYGDGWGGGGTTAGGYGDAWDGRGAAGYGYADRGSTADGYSGDGYGTAGNGYAGNGYGGATTAYPAVGQGYADGFDGAADGYAEAGNGYGGSEDYRETGNGHDGWDGYAQPGHEFTGSASYLPQDEFPELDRTASSVLVAPDTMGEWWRQADRGEGPGRGDGPGRYADHRGPVVGAVTGFLAAAVAIGVATLVAAFVRPQASPVSAVSGVFLDRIPATLRNHLVAHFGAHGATVLLLGAVALIAMVLGCLARRKPSVGVAGVAVFGLLGAFVAVTRPESRASDVLPSAIGCLAGIVALLWLAHASAPTQTAAPVRPAYGGGRRRGR
jgi:hypothetical protein